MLKKVVEKKVEGGSNYLAAIVCFLVLSVFFVAVFYAYAEPIRRNEVERIHRKYLLSMEIEGYLTDAKEALLRAELAAEGVININLSGTSKSPVGYGNQVRLVIEGDLPVDRIGFVDGSAQRQEVLSHVSMDDTGTALY